MKFVLTITASEWTEDNVTSFVEWLNNELLSSNTATGDDAQIEECKLIE